MERPTPNKSWGLVQRILLSGAPPFVTATSWIVANGQTGKIYFGKEERESREIASLTKIMTLFVAIKLMKRFNIDPYTTTVPISEYAASMSGTSALLESGDKLILSDLLHGMILPSGNDAALAISEYFGKVLKTTVLPPIDLDPKEQKEYISRLSPRKLFVKEMNRCTQELKMHDTVFANPHGLMNFNNYSSAQDIAKLASAGLKEPYFCEIVNCKRYICKALDEKENEKSFNWKNTNKLLWKGFNGIKTGITPTAGPCLATSIERDGTALIVVVLNCKTLNQRWVEVKKLSKWAFSRLKKLNGLEEKEKVLQMIVHV